MGVGASKEPKTRRFSSITNFTHWMDNMSDKKSIKIRMNKKSIDGFEGTFTLWYTDDSNDEFMNIKSNFTFNGVYAPDAEAGSIRFITRELICKLSEDGSGSTWWILPSEAPDCSINDVGVISWPWDSSETASKAVSSSASTTTSSTSSGPTANLPSLRRPSSKTITHTAPIGSMDFVGEDNPETGGFMLRLRMPQLAAGWNPSVVALNPTSGWELSKQKSMLGN